MTVAARKTGTGADLVQIVAHQQVDTALLDAMLNLFDGHDHVATYWARGRKPGFYKQPDVPRWDAFKAHLLGVAIFGAYPFRGVHLRCGCPPKEHVCEGGGTRYVCIDLDAKNGETDIRQRVGKVIAVCRQAGLVPIPTTSRSARGCHVYVFFDRRVTTAVANAAGRVIAREAGVWDRCDVIPSARHTRGYGTLHALPLSPLSEPGGGVFLDAELQPVALDASAEMLRWADSWRSDARIVETLATRTVTRPTQSLAPPPIKKRCRKRRRLNSSPSAILAASIKHHPQFRKALATPAPKWKGGRSSRDAYLVGYLRRQGLTGEEAARALVTLPGTKTAERGKDYACLVAQAQDAIEIPEKLPLAGMLLPPQVEKSAPWGEFVPPRVSPPEYYDGLPNPWWRDGVQRRLKSQRSRADGFVLAYIVDRYFRGPIQRRMYFASQREVARDLGLTARGVGGAIKRLAAGFSDIIRVVPGVSHPYLRLATAFYVVDPAHRDALNWYVEPGRL